MKFIVQKLLVCFCRATKRQKVVQASAQQFIYTHILMHACMHAYTHKSVFVHIRREGDRQRTKRKREFNVHGDVGLTHRLLKIFEISRCQWNSIQNKTKEFHWIFGSIIHFNRSQLDERAQSYSYIFFPTFEMSIIFQIAMHCIHT